MSGALGQSRPRRLVTVNCSGRGIASGNGQSGLVSTATWLDVYDRVVCLVVG
jgi:hypothetical protein